MPQPQFYLPLDLNLGSQTVTILELKDVCISPKIEISYAEMV